MPDLPTDDAMNRLAAALERANPRPWRLMGRSFLVGIATGLGATVGATVVLGLLGWALNGLGYFEVFKPGVEVIRRILPSPAPPRR
jgi:type IV secretory pathway TrbD component